MRNGKSFHKLLMLALLTGLTIFSGSCKSAQISGEDVQATLASIAPPVPATPQAEPVSFQDRDGGLWLSHNDYRALERNVIAMREYAAKLEIVIRFYRGE